MPDLASVIDSLPNALVVFDEKLQIVFRNAVAQNLLGADNDAANALQRLTVEGEYQDWTTELRQIMKREQARRFDALCRPGADHPDVYLSILCTPLRRGGDGRVAGGVILAEDVSSRINMEHRLAVSERLAAVGKLASRVAHELNNPLDGILRYTNLAIRRLGETGDEKATGYLEQARTGLLRMAEITSALLEFSRTAHTQFEQATINKIVEDAVSAMAGRAHDSQVTVVCNFHQDDMPVVRGSSLFQVACNLIKNAIDAMPSGGTLTVTTRVAGPDVVMLFEDTGAGLPASSEQLFEPFFTTKESGKGTGLGLAVCREIVERYSGSITAANRPEGGAAFALRIPVRNCAAWPIRRSGRGATPPVE